MGGGQFTPTAVGVTPIPGNKKRGGLLVVNTDGAVTVYLQPVATMPSAITTTSAPIAIGPGLSFSISILQHGAPELVGSAWQAIGSGTATAVTTWVELS